MRCARCLDSDVFNVHIWALRNVADAGANAEVRRNNSIKGQIGVGGGAEDPGGTDATAGTADVLKERISKHVGAVVGSQLNSAWVPEAAGD